MMTNKLYTLYSISYMLEFGSIIISFSIVQMSFVYRFSISDIFLEEKESPSYRNTKICCCGYILAKDRSTIEHFQTLMDSL